MLVLLQDSTGENLSTNGKEEKEISKRRMVWKQGRFSCSCLPVIRRNVLFNRNIFWKNASTCESRSKITVCILIAYCKAHATSNVSAVPGNDNTCMIIYVLLFTSKDTKTDYMNARGYFSWPQLLLEKNGDAEHNLFPGK